MTEEAKNIVEALRMCGVSAFRCEDCPVHIPAQSCENDLNAADLIESLYAELDEAQQENAGLSIMLMSAQSASETWKQMAEAIQRDFGEFSARINAGEDLMGCEYCKKNYAEGGCSCNCLNDFEWRGVQEGE